VADRNQVKLLKDRGVAAWNEWRTLNPKAQPDLSGAAFCEAAFRGANFAGAEFRADLRGADLREANLEGANLTDAYLSNADMTEADLSAADLSKANLREANLTRANLYHANLSGANLHRTNLQEANLSGVYLISTNLNETRMTNCTMVGAKLGDIDLRKVHGLTEVRHAGPSTIGIDTLYRSGGKIPERFLQGAGVKESFIAQMPYLLESLSPIEFYSCFISYSHADTAFARNLHDVLQSKGIRCWLDEHQLLPGDDIYHEVDRGIRLWDKMLLCCSENSLKSWWVDNEIGTAFEKEQQLMKDRGAKVHVLVPLNLDGYLFSDKWQSGYQVQVRRRLAADFTEANYPGKFDEQVERLIKALRADEGARESPPKQRL
jgi:hypothetical protein